MTPSVHQTENLLFITLLLQLIVMIGAARIMNSVLRSLGQPGVVGEIIAGLLLGPSLSGYFFPTPPRPCSLRRHRRLSRSSVRSGSSS